MPAETRGRKYASIVVAAAFVFTGCHDGAAPRTETTDPIDALVVGIMTTHHVPGMGVAIVRDGKIEKIEGYGVASLEWSTEVTPDTSFQIASTTKIFTATLVMLLVQEGKLGLDEPLSSYLPDAPPAWRAITIRQLAAHASGIADRTDLGAAPAAEAVRALAPAPLAFAPGASAAYENADFVVLAHVIETVTGQPFPELLRTRLFEPLGFAGTVFEHATELGPTRVADIVPRRAGVYRYEQGVQHAAWFLYPERTYAAGGAFSSLADLARWAVAMDRGELLTPASERIAAAPFKLDGGRDSGYGVVFAVSTLRGQRAYGHSGGPALADVLRFPDQRLTVIVLANQQRLYPNVAARIAGRLLPAPPAPTGIPDSDPALTARLRRVIDGFPSGTMDEEAFAPPVRAELVPALREWGPRQTSALPPLEQLVLVEERVEGAQRVRGYASVHGPYATVRWTFTLDGEGRISDVGLTME